MNNETNLEQIENKLDSVLREMRGNEFDDPHLDADGIIGARRLAHEWSDRIAAALDDPATVFAILRDFHNAHYSVFPRDELTERLCHAFYDQFVEKPETEEQEPDALQIQIDAFAHVDGAIVDGTDDGGPNPRRPFLDPSDRFDGNLEPEWRWRPKIDVEKGVIVGWPRGTVAQIYDKPSDDCAVLLDRINLNCGEYVPAFLRPGVDDDDYIVMDIDAEGRIAGWNAEEAKAWIEARKKEGGAK